MKKNSQSLVLLEMAIAILFFALSAAVILQVFMGAHQMSENSRDIVVATNLSQDIINAYTASKEEADAFFISQGYEKKDMAYLKTELLGGRDYLIVIGDTVQAGQNGTLDKGVLTILVKDKIVNETVFSRFVKGGTANE